jgi:exodeoxyribonuclease VII large subunit
MDWAPDEGGQVSVRAQATLYEPRGDYQLLVEAMRPSGKGAFYIEFLQLKAKLETEGLFLTSRKLNIPSYPKRIGVITSLQAAALQDILKTIEMHWPNCLIIIYPTPVQ